MQCPEPNETDRMRSEIERLRIKAEREESDRAWLDSVIEASPAGMIVVDGSGQMLRVNGRVEQLFGYSREELAGKSVDMLLPASARRQHLAERAGYMAEPTARPMGAGRDLYGVRKDGTQIRVEIGLSPLLAGGQTLVIASIIDISERVRAEEERGRLTEELRAAIGARDDFLAIASHELRTPLAALALQLASLQRAVRGLGAETKVVGWADKAVRNAGRLARLIDDLLDVSRIQAGKLQLHLEELDLADLVREVADRMAEEARLAGCALVVHLATGATERWDKLRVEQVLANLISNAIKYGAGKPIEVRTAVTADGARITVRDQGIGIGRDDLTRIFGRFERASAARTFRGLGLGLYITREIVEAHGGRIAAESAPGEGATFTVELPRRPPQT